MVISSMLVSSGVFKAAMTAFAMDSGRIIRFRGAPGQKVFQMAVSVAPARSAVTRIPFSRNSSLRLLVKPSAPCLDAL